MRKSPVMVGINIFSLGFPKVFGFGAGRRSDEFEAPSVWAKTKVISKI